MSPFAFAPEVPGEEYFEDWAEENLLASDGLDQSQNISSTTSSCAEVNQTG